MKYLPIIGKDSAFVNRKCYILLGFISLMGGGPRALSALAGKNPLPVKVQFLAGYITRSFSFWALAWGAHDRLPR